MTLRARLVRFWDLTWVAWLYLVVWLAAVAAGLASGSRCPGCERAEAARAGAENP